MNFDILKASLHYSKWGDSEGSISLGFDVVPHGNEYLDIGDKYVLCSTGYLPLKGKHREPVQANIRVVNDPKKITRHKDEVVACGFADFFPGRDGDFDAKPAMLGLTVVVEPSVFEEMQRMAASHPGGATLDVRIDGLEFGWEPDASHQIWDLNDTSDHWQGTRRPIKYFGYEKEVFWTSQGAIQEEADRRANAMLADSPDPEARRLAATTQVAERPDPAVRVLSQCRTLLWAIFALGVVAVVKLSLAH